MPLSFTRSSHLHLPFLTAVVASLTAALGSACSSDPSTDTGTGGGVAASGGTTSTGGSEGMSTGGDPGSGGTSGSGGATASGGAAGEFFGDSRCAAAGLLLCDGFETEEIDSALWTVGSADGNLVEIVSDQAARGSQSIHIHAANGYGYVKNTTIFPVANNDYFARMFIRVARFSTVDWAHWTIGEGEGTGDGSKIRVGGQYKTDQQSNRWGVGSDGGPTGDWTTHDSDPNGAPLEPAVGAWVCVEWEHKGSANETRFFVDGVEHPSLATTAADHGGTAVDYILPNMTSFWFGWWQYQADPEPFDVWIDEVAIDDERIGCAK